MRGLYRAGFLTEHSGGIGNRKISDVAQQHNGTLIGRERFERAHGG